MSSLLWGDPKEEADLKKEYRASSSLKCQTTIDESLKRPIEAYLISSVKIVEVNESDEEERPHQKKKGQQASKSGIPERKTRNFYAVLEIFLIEVQATKTYDR